MQKLKYPILLVHGMGFRDGSRFGYWGRIPKLLEQNGCRIFYGGQDSDAAIAVNARMLSARIREILAETGAEKLNIIAHSKGGLDCRYAISALHLGDRIASLTTVSTPHRGSKTVDLLMKLPRPLVKLTGFCTDRWFQLLGDRQPDSYQVFHSFTTAAAARFNRLYPDDPRVYYQSYAFAMRHPFCDLFMSLPNLTVRIIEGENDGLVTPRSAAWGHFRGVFYGTPHRGISHCDEVDMRRKRFSAHKANTEHCVSDIAEVYLDIVRRLAARGF